MFHLFSNASYANDKNNARDVSSVSKGRSKKNSSFFLRRPSLRRVIQVIQVMQVRLAHLWVDFQFFTLSLKLSTSLWRSYYLFKYDPNYAIAPKLPILFVALSVLISIISNPSQPLNENLLFIMIMLLPMMILVFTVVDATVIMFFTPPHFLLCFFLCWSVFLCFSILLLIACVCLAAPPN